MDVINGVIRPEDNLIVEDYSSNINGQSVLGRVKGQFFVPEGISRNKRYYSRSLWEKVLKRPHVVEKLENKTMYGTIGHEQELDDAAILDGKVSHIVTELLIDQDGKGIGEALILDTPAGKILNTLLRAGSKLYVSSRGRGKFNGTKDGIPVVDEEIYSMSTFDFVLEPGFLEAHPHLMETYKNLAKKEKENNIDDIDEGDTDMDNKIVESLYEQNNKHVQNIEKLNNQLTERNDEINSLKEERHNLNAEIQGLKEVEEENKTLSEKMEAFESLGTVEEIKEKFEKLEKTESELNEYKEIDADSDAKSIKETLDKANSLIEEFQKVGKTPDEIKETLEKFNTQIKEYKEFGTVDDVAELYTLAERLLSENKKREESEAVSNLAKAVGVSEEKIAKVYGKFTEEEIVELFKDAKAAKKFKEEKDRITNEDNEDDIDLNDDKKPYEGRSLCENLINSL